MKIAVVRFSALGDLASLSPVLKSLKYKPTIITTQLGKEYFKDEYEDFIILKSKSFFSVLKLILNVKKQNFDVVIDFQCNDRSRLITKFLNSRIYNNKDVDVFNNTTLDIFKLIVKDSGLLHDIKFDFNKTKQNYIVLNCGSSEKWKSKRLPFNKWNEISKLLYDKYNLPFYLTGDKSEVDYINQVSQHIEGECEILAGKTNLLELKEVLANAYLTISTDSAAMHISAVQGTPTIGLFGSTNWLRSAPFGPWSTVAFDKIYFNNLKPLEKNSMEVNEDFYRNIDILDSLKFIEKYL